FSDVPVPKLAAGERRSGKADVLGAFALYLVLASRVSPADALQAADAWGGDSMVTFERDQHICLRATLRGRSDRGTEEIGTALDRWAATMPAGSATVTRAASGVTLT